MIPASAFQIRDRRSGRFIQYGIVDRYKWGYLLVDDQCAATAWGGASVDCRLMPGSLTRQFDEMDLEKVAAPCCGCCGEIDRGSDGHYGWVITTRQVSPDHWRCQKHVGRLPCIIVGCTKTFAMKGDDNYDCEIVCGRHWRMAPKPMRDKVSKIRRLAKRRGWTDQLARVHDILFHRCIRTVRKGLEAPPVSDVEQSAGPPPPALTAELARLGL